MFVSRDTTLRMLDEIGKHHDSVVLEWRETLKCKIPKEVIKDYIKLSI